MDLTLILSLLIKINNYKKYLKLYSYLKSRSRRLASFSKNCARIKLTDIRTVWYTGLTQVTGLFKPDVSIDHCSFSQTFLSVS